MGQRTVLPSRVVILLALLSFVTWFPSRARAVQSASRRYFLTVFAYESRGLWNTGILTDPAESHTFATFVETTADRAIEQDFTISWLPSRLQQPGQKLDVEGPAEPGTNLSLEATISLAHQSDHHIVRFGPFEITHELFEEGRFRYNYLETYKVGSAPSGRPAQALYKAIDIFDRNIPWNDYVSLANGQAFYGAVEWRPFFSGYVGQLLASVARLPQNVSTMDFEGHALNCIHAVSDTFGFLHTDDLFGAPASRMIVETLSKQPGAFLEYPKHDDEVAKRLDAVHHTDTATFEAPLALAPKPTPAPTPKP